MVRPAARKCRNCGHWTMEWYIVGLPFRDRRGLVCGACYRELVEKATGYHQGELKLSDQPKSD